MSSIKISVILPNYNGGKYLQRTIESFIEQSYGDKELIIVDGKSTDNSFDIIGEYSKVYSNIIWVKEKDTCVTDGFNIGLRYAAGDLIGFMASDSIYYTNDVFAIINSNYRKIKFDVIYFDAYSYFVEEKVIKLRSCNYVFDRETFLKIGCFVPFENIFIDRAIYEKHQMDVNYNLSSDIELYLRIIGEKILALYINQPSTINIYDGGNLSNVFRAKQQEQWEMVDIKFLFDQFDSKDHFELHKLILDKKLPITKENIKRAEKWLIRLVEANATQKFYDDAVFKNKYMPQWVYLCTTGQKFGLWAFFVFMKSPLTRYSNLTTAQRIKFYLGCFVRPFFPRK